jgi:hypothetical protein
MRGFSIPVALALAAASLLAFDTPARAGERPIEAEGIGGLDARDDFSSLGMQGSGEGDHLGKCSLFVSLDPIEFLDFGHLVPLNVRLHAANGDNLLAEIEGEFDPETGILAATITFGGGTGRFADATGTANLLIAFDNWQGPFHGARFLWALEGTIDF